MIITLDWPPSLNAYWRRSSKGGKARTHLSNSGRAYKESAEWIIRAAMSKRDKATLDALKSGPIRLDVVFYPPDKRRRDIDNLHKIILDAMQEANLIIDDSQVDELHTYRGPVVKTGKVKVSAQPVSADRLLPIWAQI